MFWNSDSAEKERLIAQKREQDKLRRKAVKKRKIAAKKAKEQKLQATAEREKKRAEGRAAAEQQMKELFGDDSHDEMKKLRGLSRPGLKGALAAKFTQNDPRAARPNSVPPGAIIPGLDQHNQESKTNIPQTPQRAVPQKPNSGGTAGGISKLPRPY